MNTSNIVPAANPAFGIPVGLNRMTTFGHLWRFCQPQRGVW